MQTTTGPFWTLWGLFDMPGGSLARLHLGAALQQLGNVSGSPPCSGLLESERLSPRCSLAAWPGSITIHDTFPHLLSAHTNASPAPVPRRWSACSYW